MYNIRDTQFKGKHDYDEQKARRFASLSGRLTFSIGIFQWELKANGKTMKKGKTVVRVKGSTSEQTKVFTKAEEILLQLDDGTYTGKKSITI